MSRHESAAWPHLCALDVGDVVPAALYVLDYADGERPAWTVDRVRLLDTGGRVLELYDPGNLPAALTVITHAGKTLRSGPHRRGGRCGDRLCDLDQQGRRYAGADVQEGGE